MSTKRHGHGHKGPKTKSAQLKNVPLVAMTPQELDHTFDELGRDNSAAILDEARTGTGNRIEIAAAVLCRPGNLDVIAYYVDEYGDGEGSRMVDGFIESCQRLGLLRPGETLQRENYTPSGFTRVQGPN